MKKILAILMVAVIGTSFTACGKKLGVITSSTMASSEAENNITSSQPNNISSEVPTSSTETSSHIIDFGSNYGCTHDYDAATCTMPKSCVLCGATYGSALGHNWKSATCTVAKTCKRCGQTEGKALGHSWKEATCTEAKTCKNCGATSGSALGHNWKDATYDSPARCSRCNKTSGSALEAVYTGTSIHTLPARTTFNVGEEFDDTGLTLRKNYSDGSYEIIESGFETSGFSSSKEGTCKITVKYKNKYMNETVTFDVKIVVEDVALRKLTAFTGYNTVKTDVYDSYGNYYDRCMALSGTDEYLLNGNYSRLVGKIAVEEGFSKDEYYTINIYADDKLVYTKDKISPYNEPFDINVDIKKCKMLKIKVTATERDYWADDDYLLLINAELKK